jgi:glutamyl-tRNA synthetase
LRWLNQQYIKEADNERLAKLTQPFLERDGCTLAQGAPLASVVALLKERVSTIEELADAAVYFYRALEPSAELKQQHYAADIKPALVDLQSRLATIEWGRAKINEVVKSVVAEHKLKMPKLAMPLRVMVTGEAQTPSIDATLELIGREQVLARITKQLQAFPA